MPKSDPYVEFVVERLSALGEITVRSMFGGYMIYCDGTPFALISRNVLYLKADDGNRPDFDARGLAAFQPFDGPGVMSYYETPPELFEDVDALRHWGGAAVAAGRRARTKKKPSKRAR